MAPWPPIQRLREIQRNNVAGTTTRGSGGYARDLSVPTSQVKSDVPTDYFAIVKEW